MNIIPPPPNLGTILLLICNIGCELITSSKTVKEQKKISKDHLSYLLLACLPILSKNLNTCEEPQKC